MLQVTDIDVNSSEGGRRSWTEYAHNLIIWKEHMMKRSVFDTYHPAINFIFFCIVIISSIFTMNPVLLGISLISAGTYAYMLNGKRTVRFILFFILPLILFAAVINAIVNPRGETVIFYTEYSRITMEAALYGICTGIMISSMLLWFSCFTKIMTGDKFTYMFGKIMPSISLIITMVMRFVPDFKGKIAEISNAQKGIGCDVTEGRAAEKVRHGIKITSIMFSWSLENSVDTADSMRARGYGAKKRSSFAIYDFDKRDAAAVFVIALATAVFISGAISGRYSVEFYPDISMPEFMDTDIILYAAYALLCFFPAIVEFKEAILWRYLRSKI